MFRLIIEILLTAFVALSCLALSLVIITKILSLMN